VTVVAGAYGGHQPPPPPPKSWAASADSDVAIWTLKLEAGASLTLPPAKAGSNRVLYFFRGERLTVSGEAFPRGVGIAVQADAPCEVANGDAEAEVLVLQGRPLGEPVVQYGPFVMNSQHEIREAFADYQRTQFGGWPFDRDDPVHPREQGRFARRPDGSEETPG
jgi:redox-sensitive bicupin YhaK (pirin superfamily)